MTLINQPVAVEPETLPCARCGLPGAALTIAGMMHPGCFEAEREDAFADSPGFYVGGDLNEWFRTGDIHRRPPPKDADWPRPRRAFKSPPVLAVLRDLCRDTSTSWSVSDLPGRVTTEASWAAACATRLGMDVDQSTFDAARDALVEEGKVGRDRPELPPSLAGNPHWRVRPLWPGAALSARRPAACRLDQRRLELLRERAENPEVKVCIRCGSSTMFKRAGPDVQTAAWMCSRCDHPDRFASIEHARDDGSINRHCEICGGTAAAWAAGRLAPRCGNHLDTPEA